MKKIINILVFMLMIVAACSKQPRFDGTYFASTEGTDVCGVDATKLNFEFESDDEYFLFAEKEKGIGFIINKNYSETHHQPEQTITICKNRNQKNGECIDEIIKLGIGCDWCYYFKEINGSFEQYRQGGMDCLSGHLQYINLLKERYK